MNSQPMKLDESEDSTANEQESKCSANNESARLARTPELRQDSSCDTVGELPPNPSSSDGSKKRNSGSGFLTKQNANRRSIQELEDDYHDTKRSSKDMPATADKRQDSFIMGGAPSSSRHNSSGEPSRDSTGRRCGEFRKKTLEDLEDSYTKIQSDKRWSAKGIPHTAPSSEVSIPVTEPRRLANVSRRASSGERNSAPDLRRNSSGKLDNQRHKSFCDLEESEKELSSSGDVSGQEMEKAFLSKNKSRLGSFLNKEGQQKRGSVRNKDADAKISQSSQTSENSIARPEPSALKRAPSNGMSSSHDGDQRLSMWQLEGEARNLERLRRQDHDKPHPGAYAVATLSRSDSATPSLGGAGTELYADFGGIGIIPSLRSLETSILTKHSARASIPSLNAPVDGEDLTELDNSSGRRNGLSSERWSSSAEKTEIGLTPGGPRPGAYEAQYSLQPAWVAGNREEVESTGSFPADSLGWEYLSTATDIPEDVEQQPPERSNPPTSGINSEGGNEAAKAKSKRRRRNTLFLIVIAVAAGAAVAVGIRLGVDSGGSSSSGSSTPDGGCTFGGEQSPSILEQCQCADQIRVFPEDVLDHYALLINALIGTVYDKYDEDTYSCSTRNLAVAHVATEKGFDNKSQVQRFLLVFLFLSWEGKSWTRNDGWLSADPECTWYGVSCRDGEVTGLEFSNNNMVGTLVRELYFLDFLEVFVAQGTNTKLLKGQLLSEFGLLTNLRIFTGSFAFSGTLPTEIGQATLLEKFRIDSKGNFIEGTIPTEFGMLTRMEDIKLFAMLLEGSVPSEIGRLTTLKSLDLSLNNLVGEIPSQLHSLSMLTSLEIHGNQFTGTIPDISTFPDIIDYSIGHNQFIIGASLNALWNSTNLVHVDLSNVGLQGSIPRDALGSMTNLEYLDLQNNRVDGTLPTTIGRLSRLEYLSLGQNDISGTIPSELGLCSSLSILHLPGNVFSGIVPSELLEIPNLDELFLNENLLSGTLSREYCVKLEELQVTCSSIPCPCDTMVCVCARSAFD